MQEKGLNYSPIMIHVVGSEGTIDQANNVWFKKMGYEEEEVIGKSPLEFLSEESKEKRDEQDLLKLFKDGVARDLEISFNNKDGEVIKAIFNNFPQFDHDGEFICAFAALSENRNAGIMAYDMLVGKGVWTPTVCSLLGIKEKMEEVYFANHCSRLHEEDLYAFEDIFVSPLDPNIPLLENYRIRKESGEYIPVSWWAQNVVHRAVIEEKEVEANEESEEIKENEENEEAEKKEENAHDAQQVEIEKLETFDHGDEGEQKEEKITRLLISSIIPTAG